MGKVFTQAEINRIREDFPLISQVTVNEKPLVYLDSAATSQRPYAVLDAEREFLETKNAAVHRGVHYLSELATEAYENSRIKIAEFIGAKSPKEVIFTKSATESLNLLAYSLGNPAAAEIFGAPLGVGDEIVITELEHHANLIPWQQLAERTGATLRWFKINSEGRIEFKQDLINSKTKIVAFTHSSNVTGAISPVKELVTAAHKVGALVILDACQSVPHQPIKVQELDVDFMTFSGHKMLGPYGIGILYGKYDLLEKLPPFLTGGSMIKTVSMDSAVFAEPPEKFEAGVPPVSQIVGLATAIDYLNDLGMENIANYEHYLTEYLLTRLKDIPGISIVGPQDMQDRGSAVAFTLEGVHPHDIGQILDNEGIAIRVGHHCAIPVHKHFEIGSSARASLYLYNTEEEVYKFIAAIELVKKFFKV